MAIYKVSYVIIGEDDFGAILNQDHAPLIGEEIKLQNRKFEIIEVFQLVPSRGEFHYYHATCVPLKVEN